MGTELRDVVKGLMVVLDLTALFLHRGQSCERLQVEVRTLQAESTLISLFLYSIGAVCFCFSQQAESHRKCRQPDQETTEADSFHLS